MCSSRLSLSLSLSLRCRGFKGGSRFFPASQQRLVFWPTRRMQCRSKRNELSLSLSLCLETHQKSRYSLDLGLIIAKRDRERRPNRRDDDDVKQRLTWQPSPPPACVERKNRVERRRKCKNSQLVRYFWKCGKTRKR